MALSTNLNVPPYFDDYDPTKQYYKILFQPGVSVQVRELNQLQTMFAEQVRRIGDNIFDTGTIVNGCNFNFTPSIPYVKINDVNADGTPAVVSLYSNNLLTNSNTGLQAQIIQSYDGFQSQDPDLKTLYLRYNNQGFSGNVTTFSPGDILTVEDINYQIWSVVVDAGGSAFSNNDTVVAVSQLVVNVSSGSFSNGGYITNGTANVQIVNIDTQTYANSNQILLKVAPRTSDLSQSGANTAAWTFNFGDAVTDSSNVVAGRVEGVIGSGFNGKVVTSNVGAVQQVVPLAGGLQYTEAPYMTISSPTGTVGSLTLTPLNYIAEVVVASTANSVGNGYMFSVSNGVIYQKGYFLRADQQSIIVSKYDTAPDNVSVGFATSENIITPDIDTSLFDNAIGVPDTNAPGANRLQMVPTLTILNQSNAQSNANFFSLVSWSEGNPYQQSQYTVYDKINDELAQRTSETDGDYIVDSFLMSTRSPIDPTLQGNTYSVVVDPGTAYIEGYRVATSTNFAVNTSKDLDTYISNAHSIAIAYQNYITIQNVGGLFQFNTGDTVTLYDTAQNFLGTAGARTGAVKGNAIGTANMRSLVLNTGEAGVASSQYLLYVFNIQMNQGKSFQNVQSVVYFNASNQAVGFGDVVQVVVNTTNTMGASVTGANSSALLFSTGADSLLNANNLTYTYRTIDGSLSVAANGIASKSITSNPNEVFPYGAGAALSAANMADDLYVVPLGGDLIFNSNIAGTVATSNSTTITGTGTTFLGTLQSGDWVEINSNRYQVNTVINSTSLTLTYLANTTASGLALYRMFPQYVPVPFGQRSGLSANVNSTQTTLTLNFGTTFQESTTTLAMGCNILRQNISQANKSPARNVWVAINTSNNSGGQNGPWCLGVPDIFRLRGVYVGNSSVDNTAPNALTSFYVDHNQTIDYYNLGYLYLAPKANAAITSNSTILVNFDYFTTSNTGVSDTVSYCSSNVAVRTSVDSLPLANLTTQVSSWEVPEIFDDYGDEYDLLQYFDFRPICNTTVTPSTTFGAAPLNPAETVSFGNTKSTTAEKRFPLPGSVLTCDMEQFIGRTDSVVISTQSQISVLNGKSSPDPTKQYSPTLPAHTMKLTDLVVPAYPSIEVVQGPVISVVLNTYVMNGHYLKQRLDLRAITKPSSSAGTTLSTPQVYTMADIDSINQRLTDVEYYVSLNMLQSNVSSLTVPSSVNPSLNRFMYGFFADDASTYAFSDRENPTYAAFIEDNAFVPEKMTIDMNLVDAIGGPDFVDFPIISQTIATWPDSLGPVCILQYVTYNVIEVNGQYYLNIPPTASAPATTTQIDPTGLTGNVGPFILGWDGALSMQFTQQYAFENGLIDPYTGTVPTTEFSD